MTELYEMLFKRKSVRRYDSNNAVSQEVLTALEAYLQGLQPLFQEISVSFRIVKRTQTNCLWGEYCLLAYSEEKTGYLENMGYLLEQVDLYLVSRGIGTCWYGMGRPYERDWEGKRFVIMLAFGACKSDQFRRKGEFPRRRDVWSDLATENSALKAVIQTACRAPSACNSQPWRLEVQQNVLRVSRAVAIRTPFTASLTDYMNLIDVGIFLCALEIVLQHEKLAFQRKILPLTEQGTLVPVVDYLIESQL